MSEQGLSEKGLSGKGLSEKGLSEGIVRAKIKQPTWSDVGCALFWEVIHEIDGTVGFPAVTFQSSTTAINVAKSVLLKSSLSSYSVLFRMFTIAVIVQFCAAVQVRASSLLRPVVAVCVVGLLDILLRFDYLT